MTDAITYKKRQKDSSVFRTLEIYDVQQCPPTPVWNLAPTDDYSTACQ